MDRRMTEIAFELNCFTISKLKTVIVAMRHDATRTDAACFRTLLSLVNKYGLHPSAAEFYKQEVRRLRRQIDTAESKDSPATVTATATAPAPLCMRQSADITSYLINK